MTLIFHVNAALEDTILAKIRNGEVEKDLEFIDGKLHDGSACYTIIDHKTITAVFETVAALECGRDVRDDWATPSS